MSQVEAAEKVHSPPQFSARPSCSGGYDPSFFEQLAQIEDRHFWFRARNRLISSIARRLTRELKTGYLVLEVGCGTGNVLRALRQACPDGKVVGLELWFDGLRFAQQRFSGPLVQGDVRRCPFGKPFDLIGMFDVLEHIPQELETLTALRESIAPEGRLILTVPAHQYWWSYFDEAAHHCRRYSPSDIRERLTAAGFEVEFLSQFMTIIFPLVWLVRKISGRRKESGSEAARNLTFREFRIVPVMSELLTGLLNLEASWLSRGHHLPIGTSLIVVARRAATD
jgi:SAM-dependent methyltransferase